MDIIEVEIKSLLGTSEKANKLIDLMKKKDPNMNLIRTGSQLNHYFIDGNIQSVVKIASCWSDELSQLKRLSNKSKSYSVRTRKTDTATFLIIKSTIDDTTSENGTARIELEIPTPHKDIEVIDGLLLQSGFNYQAKWSRERKEYRYKNFTVCVDKNAGYGYLAEFEIITKDRNSVKHAKMSIKQEFAALEIEELPQDRLERMFEHYNANWQDYYGTDNIFTIY